MIPPSKYVVKQEGGKLHVVDTPTYIPAHERERVWHAYQLEDLKDLLDEIEDDLIEGGMGAGYDKIQQLKKEISQLEN